MSEDYYGDSLIADWSQNKETSIPAPLSVRSRRYRQLIASWFKHHLSLHNEILSIGAGTGIGELNLEQAGFTVKATDVDTSALSLCRARGLQTAYLDVLDPVPNQKQYTAIYVDGVLGHFHPSLFLKIFHNLRTLTKPNGCLLVSNDLSDSDAMWFFTVTNAEHVRFYRPPKMYFASVALRAGWRLERSSVLRYRRPGRGWRRREICLFVASGY